MQKKLVLTKPQLKHTNITNEMYTFDCSPDLNFPKTTIPVPLPQIFDEFGVATLALKFKLRTLLKVLMLLLLENSFLLAGNKE